MVMMLVSGLSGCESLKKLEKDFGSELDGPPLVRSELLSTLSVNFSFEIQSGILINYYSLVLGVNQSFVNGAYLEVKFEDPSNRDNPIVVHQYVAPRDIRIVVQSPPIQGLRSYTNYEIVVGIYADQAKTKKIGEHVQLVQSLLDDIRQN
jgi:hypothetical protein